ncbi:MAG: flavin reductase family protein, partial [Planctomycetota bacterium]|nr:flavin reductase family protein [Planctomycetota bacterium]
MQFEPSVMPPRDVYHWMTRLINPRPIAWVSSISNQGIPNLAPYSFFNGVGSTPPTLLFCPANRRDGSPKDTLANIQQVGEFVVNIVTLPLAEAMHKTASELDPEIDEFDFASLEKRDSSKVKVPRVAAA